MKHITLFPLFVALCFPGIVWGQRGLKDIPDPSVEAQRKSFSLPAGAEINLFASEPMVTKPIHMNWDTQGRLWVVGSPLYPHIKPGQAESDQLVVLEDTDGDGRADRQQVFAADLHIPTGVLPGDGGVYVANSNEILFLKDTDGDGKADHRVVVLSGFGTEDTHHLVHTLRWGPEGMMWMNQSIYIHTHLETPYGVRRLLGGGVWHYRPETRRAEVFMKGLVNPWGHVFDAWGQSFFTDGAGGDGINFGFPRATFVASPGAARRVRGLNPGQPKMCGLERLTGSHLPEAWQDALAAPDFRGHRISSFRLSDKGSNYVSVQGPDLVASTHRAFRPVDVKMGPDGAVYIADFYNPIIQHGEVDFRDPRRDHEHGRIWRISFPGRPAAPFVKPARMSNAELVQAAIQSEEGVQRELVTAELRTRNADEIVLPALERVEGASDLPLLRRIWVSQVIGRFDEAGARDLALHGSAKARAGALRALYYEAPRTKDLLPIAEAAVADPSAQVRLWGVSLLAQMDAPNTVEIALRALDGVEVDDPLDFALWSICREHEDRWVSAMEAREGANPFRSTGHLLFASAAVGRPLGADRILADVASGKIADEAEVAKVARWIASNGSREQVSALYRQALASKELRRQHLLLTSVLDAAKLRKMTPRQDGEKIVTLLQSPNDSIFELAANLAGLWKVNDARTALQEVFSAAEISPKRRQAALDGLVALGGAATSRYLNGLIGDPAQPVSRKVLAVSGLLRVQPGTAAEQAVRILRLPGLKEERVADLFGAFLRNKAGTAALTKALEGVELSAPVALKGLHLANSAPTRPAGLIAVLQQAGQLKPMKMQLRPEEMEAMIARVNQQGDARRGEAVYRRFSLQCIACHAIGGAGGKVGPDLVSIGSSAPVDYLIESLLEPSKKIKEGYHTSLITLKNDDSLAGSIVSETRQELVLRDMAGKEQRIAKTDIAEQSIAPISLMPVGLTAQLREDEFVDLVRFLSELGKQGDFKTGPNRFVRHWRVLSEGSPNPGTIGHYGSRMFTDDFAGYVWQPFYADVAGALPVEEIPVGLMWRRTPYRVAQTYFDVAEGGEFAFRLRGDLGALDVFINGKAVEVLAQGSEATVLFRVAKAGRQRVTLVSRMAGQGELSLEALVPETKLRLISADAF